jgi:hypothetical protein
MRLRLGASGPGEIVRPRRHRALLRGPSTSPLEVGSVSDVFGFANLLGVRSLREGDNYE